MQYSFPHITHIDQLRAALDGRTEFIFAERDGVVIANYLVNLIDTFPSDDTRDEALNEAYRLRREARGIIFCAKTGKVLARRYHKFFNLGEKAECAADKVDFTQPHIILEKLDGSMITPFKTADGIMRWGTKMGETEVAMPVNKFVADNAQYQDFSNEMIAKDFTPIFEWCSRKQRIVIDYPVDRLVLTAIRDNVTGRYVSYSQMVDLGKHYNIDVVQALDGNVTDVHEFIEMVRNLKNAEGFVIRFENGHMIKVKAEEYLQIHRAKELITHEKDLWAVILDEKLDDLLPLLDKDDQDQLSKFASDLNVKILEKADELKWEVIAWVDNNGDSQKKFAVDFVNAKNSRFTDAEKGLLFKIKAGKDPIDVVHEYVRKKCSTATTINEVRPLVGGLKWDRYAAEE
jgi:RNA ligase